MDFEVAVLVRKAGLEIADLLSLIRQKSETLEAAHFRIKIKLKPVLQKGDCSFSQLLAEVALKGHTRKMGEFSVFQVVVRKFARKIGKILKPEGSFSKRQ